MTEFIIGLILGGLLVFCLMEFNRWKMFMIQQFSATPKQDGNIQWRNLINYDGSERGQQSIEN